MLQIILESQLTLNVIIPITGGESAGVDVEIINANNQEFGSCLIKRQDFVVCA